MAKLFTHNTSVNCSYLKRDFLYSSWILICCWTKSWAPAFEILSLVIVLTVRLTYVGTEMVMNLNYPPKVFSNSLKLLKFGQYSYINICYLDKLSKPVYEIQLYVHLLNRWTKSTMKYLAGIKNLFIDIFKHFLL